ncbi:hypothetical protein GCM10010358_25600 [Streptomyces minutiscleroticus]|uniref:Uncharacterized protein n=1 Tax=Streptomyces minutiscleroticus TaxID=68238 RepID=A0A918NII3_9ACTN|nr:hypothetical protein GCM10010358_25600 [Streptomyces minutiscleroticus]
MQPRPEQRRLAEVAHVLADVDQRATEARNVAKAAASRKPLTLVSYGLREGEVRGLSRRGAA